MDSGMPDAAAPVDATFPPPPPPPRDAGADSSMGPNDAGPDAGDGDAGPSADAGVPDAGPPGCVDDVCFRWLSDGETVDFGGCNVGSEADYGTEDRCPVGFECDGTSATAVCRSVASGAEHTISVVERERTNDNVFVELLIDPRGYDLSKMSSRMFFRGIDGSEEARVSPRVTTRLRPGTHRVEVGSRRGELIVNRSGSVEVDLPLASLHVTVTGAEARRVATRYAGTTYGVLQNLEDGVREMVFPAPAEIEIASTSSSSDLFYVDSVSLADGDTARVTVPYRAPSTRYEVRGTITTTDPALDVRTGTVVVRNGSDRFTASVGAGGTYRVQVEPGRYDVGVSFPDAIGAHVDRDVVVGEDVTRDYEVERFDVRLSVTDAAGAVHEGVSEWRYESAADSGQVFGGGSAVFSSVAYGVRAARPTIELTLRGDGVSLPGEPRTYPMQLADEPMRTVHEALVTGTLTLTLDGEDLPTEDTDWRGTLTDTSERWSQRIRTSESPATVDVVLWADTDTLRYRPPYDWPTVSPWPVGSEPLDVAEMRTTAALTRHMRTHRVAVDMRRDGVVVEPPPGATLSLEASSEIRFSPESDGRLWLWSGAYSIRASCSGCGGAVPTVESDITL